MILVALFPAVNGYFFIPTIHRSGGHYFDRTVLPYRQKAEPLVHASRTCFGWRCRAGVAFHQDILRETAAFNPLYIGLCLLVYGECSLYSLPYQRLMVVRRSADGC